MDYKPYKRAVLGGTFDRFHDAHRSLLYTAAFIAEEVFAGIVSEELGNQLFKSKKYNKLIEHYEIRAKNVNDYLKQFCSKIDVSPLYDNWGPAPTDIRADVIVVSHQTKSAAYKINEMRRDNNLTQLDIVVIPWLRDKNGNLLSSTLFRKKDANSRLET